VSDTGAPKPDWYPDPSGRFEFRYWDGETWTGHVSQGGESSWDPPPGSEDTATTAEGDTPAATEAYTPEQAEPTPEPDPDWSAGSGAETPVVADEWAPQEASPAAEATEWAPQAEEPVWSGGQAADAADDADTNLVAISAGGLGAETGDWLRQVAAQVDPRLARINPGWSANPQAEAARACAFGLLLGHLAGRYPHTRDDISKVAEAHPSFSTLDSGTRLQILEQIAGDPQRAAAWLGPLIDVPEADRVAMLFD
jgi:hypothetical protein